MEPRGPSDQSCPSAPFCAAQATPSKFSVQPSVSPLDNPSPAVTRDISNTCIIFSSYLTASASAWPPPVHAQPLPKREGGQLSSQHTMSPPHTLPVPSLIALHATALVCFICHCVLTLPRGVQGSCLCLSSAPLNPQNNGVSTQRMINKCFEMNE